MNNLNPNVYYMIHYYGVKSRIFVFFLGAEFKLSHIESQFKKKKSTTYMF